MIILGAQFQFPLKALSLRFIAESETLTRVLIFNVGDFRVRLMLDSRESTEIGKADSLIKSFFFDHISAELEHTYTEAQVDAIFTEHFAYQNAREEYLEALREAVNRVVHYFKLKIGGPTLNFVGPFDLLRNESLFYDPAWFRAGERIEQPFGDALKKSGVVLLEGGLFLGDYGLGVSKLTDTAVPELEAFVQVPREQDLFEQILSDAQSAAVGNNYRRAVLELAVATEIFIKNSFFARDSVASAAIDYLEGAGGRSLKAVELINGAAKNAFGVSFKESYLTDFQNINHLFRARNNIAHKGQCWFRSDNAQFIEVDRDLLKSWWKSVLIMKSWLTAQLAARTP